ncbi:MAG: hypothetical protein HFG72_02120 [Hungatella sp.]|nr:hypothetical protein [Hungatella sp.]
MSDDNAIERIAAAHVHNLLEPGQRPPVVAEILCKFIPDKYNGFQIMFSDYFTYPLYQTVNVKIQGSELSLLGNSHDLPHKLLQSVPAVTVQVFNNPVYIFPGKHVCILRGFHQGIKILFIGLIREPFDSGIL